MTSNCLNNSSHQLNTPVLFMIFNRLDTTKRVFESISLARPTKLYIAADGARESRKGEQKKVEQVREYILDNIDWECDVKTLFREINLGCKLAVSEAITWFFENEEQGVILEDDCLPTQSFFWFCEELLNKYKNDLRVWQISGDNFQWGTKHGDGDYYLSHYNHIWGWATWADRWAYYDVNLEALDRFKKLNVIDGIFSNANERKYWLDCFEKVANNEIDTWDYQWSFTVFANNGLTILPNKNLIENIGFGEDATHTFDLESKLANIKTEELNFPIRHPTFIYRNTEADETTSVLQFRRKSVPLRVISKILKLVKD